MRLSRDPIIVDPHGHISDEDKLQIYSQFEATRGQSFQYGPPMYLISPTDSNKLNMKYDTSSSDGKKDFDWKPSFTANQPEKVVLLRTCALAKRSFHHLLQTTILSNTSFLDSSSWITSFQESYNSLKSYNALLRIDPELVVDKSSSSTRMDGLLLSGADNSRHGVQSSFTRSLEIQVSGYKKLRKKLYKNLNNTNSSGGILVRIYYSKW